MEKYVVQVLDWHGRIQNVIVDAESTEDARKKALKALPATSKYKYALSIAKAKRDFQDSAN